jgi:hypothetical protein
MEALEDIGVRKDGGIDWRDEVLQSEPPRLLSYTFQTQISDTHRGELPSRVTSETSVHGRSCEAHFDPRNFRVSQRDLIARVMVGRSYRVSKAFLRLISRCPFRASVLGYPAKWWVNSNLSDRMYGSIVVKNYSWR